MPANLAWLEPVLIAAAVVFVVDLIGNIISFQNRVINALVSAIVFAIIFGALGYTGLGSVKMTASLQPSPTAPMNAGQSPMIGEQ